MLLILSDGRRKGNVFLPKADLISPELFLIFYLTLLMEVFIRSPPEVGHVFVLDAQLVF